MFLNFYLFIFLSDYLLRLNTNNKRHFLTHTLTSVSNLTQDGTTNETTNC